MLLLQTVRAVLLPQQEGLVSLRDRVSAMMLRLSLCIHCLLGARCICTMRHPMNSDDTVDGFY